MVSRSSRAATARARLEALSGYDNQSLREMRRLEQRNRELERRISLLQMETSRQRERIVGMHDATQNAQDLADMCERRYIGICSLLRMVLDEFDRPPER